MLRRPISICEIDKNHGTISIVFEVRGAGTAKLADFAPGDDIDMIAPLGRGFALPERIDNDKRVLVVGGGIGVPPLLGIAKTFGDSTTAILGFRSADKVILEDNYRSFGTKVTICTDDGSAGIHGFVTEPLKSELESGEIAAVYACGPLQMLKNVVQLCKAANVPCQVSLEERMGCGVGACACCVCEIEREGKRSMLRVCKDGPVFDGNEVVW